MKMLAAAVAAMSMMAFAGSASATTLTSPSGTTYSGELALTGEDSLSMHTGFTNVTCTEYSMAGTPNAQSDTTTVTGPIATLTFPAASCSRTITVLTKGSLEIHKIGSGPNGTLTGKNSRITFADIGISCVYGTSAAGTDLGTLTGSTITGGTATMDISAEIPLFEGSEFFCAHPAHWEGKMKVTRPDFLDVS